MRAAEFFAGIGLVRLALEQEGFEVVFANDIDKRKCAIYSANFRPVHFVLGDIRAVAGAAIPDCELATASFPCTDLSLAGNRAGLNGKQSGAFWEFTRVIEEMGSRRPAVVLLENVIGFATSRNGQDLAAAIRRLNDLGYVCDIFAADARWFVPQSRPRLFIVGSTKPVPEEDRSVSLLRPAWMRRFLETHPELSLHSAALAIPNVVGKATLPNFVEPLSSGDARWWDAGRVSRFLESLSPIQSQRLQTLRSNSHRTWATAYRRTREGKPVWEIRADGLSGCLRTAKGGSGRQALVELAPGRLRIRWMLAKEYAGLQGAPDFRFDGSSENEALSAFGDAVCVPVIRWIAREYLRPLLDDSIDHLPAKPGAVLLA